MIMKFLKKTSLNIHFNPQTVTYIKSVMQRLILQTYLTIYYMDLVDIKWEVLLL